jgi:hypothetical protein
MVKITGSFQFKINWATIRYLGVCAVALGGALLGQFVLGDYELAIILAFGGYIVVRVLLWVFYKE